MVENPTVDGRKYNGHEPRGVQLRRTRTNSTATPILQLTEGYALAANPALFAFRAAGDVAPKFYPVLSSLLAFELPCWG